MRTMNVFLCNAVYLIYVVTPWQCHDGHKCYVSARRWSA